MSRTRFPRPPHEYPGSFANLLVLPEVAGATLGDLMREGRALRIWCRACGRDTVFTPHGIGTLFPSKLALTVEDFTLAAKCQTCGAHEAQASGAMLEAHDRRSIILRRERHGLPRLC